MRLRASCEIYQIKGAHDLRRAVTRALTEQHAIFRAKGTLGIVDTNRAAVSAVEMELVARRQLGAAIEGGQAFIREPAREPCARVLIEIVVEVAVGFNSGRRGVVACRMGPGMNRLGEHNGFAENQS